MDCVIGLDVGTQGARAAAFAADGSMVAQATAPFRNAIIKTAPPVIEQDPEAWWNACVECLSAMRADLADASVRAICVDSTSGTFVPVDGDGTPLRPAIMYNDGRAGPEIADEVQAAGMEVADRLGYRFPPAFALPKMLWLRRFEPEVFSRTHKLLHAADYIVGRLTGRFDISDSSNALKSGYDLERLCWPAFIERELGIPLAKLPDVASPGQVVAEVSLTAAVSTGLRPGVPVVAGATDGTASFLAAGACAPGEWNSVLGTTIVLRGVSERIVHDPHGRYYCHRHPEGHWLPGGASNVGGECLERAFPQRDFADLDAQAPAHLPSGITCYPLVRTGERAPFVSSSAEGFTVGSADSEAGHYAALLQGVALVERWCFETFIDLGATIGDSVRATGGGSKSDVWAQLRANVLQRRILRPAVADATMGVALLAASACLHAGLTEAALNMVRIEREFDPDPGLADLYAGQLSALRNACVERGYCT